MPGCRDKVTPNSLRTYHNVMLSIFSAVDEKEIAEHFKLAYELKVTDAYAKDIAAQQAEQKAKAPASKVPRRR